jgi:hypothetical protein
MTSSTVTGRRRWNAPESTVVPLDALSGFHYRNEAGGVCSALPRAFLCAHVWCDQVSAGAFGHVCRDGAGPHEVLVFILRNDNPSDTYEELLQRARH